MGKTYTLAKGQNIVFDVPEKYRPQQTRTEAASPEELSALLELSRQKKARVAVCKASSSTSSHSAPKESNPRRRRDLLFNKLIRIAVLALLFFSLGMLGKILYGYMIDSETDDAIKDYILGSATPIPSPDREVPAYPLPTDPPLTYPSDKGPDLEKLTEYSQKYEDFKFWLYIEDTSTSYYVMQAKDNDFYLYRNIYKKENVSGSLFLDYRNDAKELGGNNIVYGHAMANGTMFGMLNRFRKEDYFNSHRTIYTYSASEVTVWRIYSAYETTTDNYYIQTYFSSEDEYLKFLRKTQNDCPFTTDIVLTSQDDILTLSTCHKDNVSNGRFVVHAVKVGTCPIT